MAQESDRSAGGRGAGDKLHGSVRSAVADPTALYDSNLRVALALIESADWDQLAARTGIECFNKAPQFLSLFIELDPAGMREKNPKVLDMDMLAGFELLVPRAYATEYAKNPALRTLAVRIELMSGNPSRTAKGTPVEELLRSIADSGAIRRVRIAVPHGKCLERSLAALDFPPPGAAAFGTLAGQNIVIGIIDDGCAFAHPDFLEIRHAGTKRTYRTRVLALWDQSQPATAADKANGWSDNTEFGYGRELGAAAIDATLAQHISPHGIREDDVYAALRYDVGAPGELATHGTRVMGIAAGNGNSMMGWQGIAPRADIIFVQLPPEAIQHTPKLLSDNIVHGVQYIFERAEALNKKATVVNISYGGYAGPHDGTSHWESAIDELLNVADRAVVVSAGNGFEQDCHAMATLQAGEERTLRWILQPEDATGNDLELWYNGDAALSIRLEPPGGAQAFGPFVFCKKTNLTRIADGAVLGLIEHVQEDPSNGDNSATIALHPTAADSPSTNIANLAPPGTWMVRLRNVGNVAAEVHAWIQRDDVGRPGARQQSRFAREDAYPGYTIGDFATGKLTISAGAFNVATDQVCAYSACGPTRAYAGHPSRPKPDLCAPAEELASGGGVLTTGSRQGAPARLNGTSAAAPHVAGIVALAFDYRRNHKKQHLTATELRTALSGQTTGRALAPNVQQAIDPGRKVKQKDMWKALIGAGKISCAKTLYKL